MSDSLYVDYEELERTRSEVLELLNQFNDCSTEFGIKLQELKEKWDGPDYQVMSESVISTMGPITGAEGKIPNLMREIASELENKYNEYKSIQSSNIGYWG